MRACAAFVPAMEGGGFFAAALKIDARDAI